LAQLAKSLKSVFVYDGVYSEHRRRNHGRPVTGLPATRFLGFSQNHDQIGNRAAGERTSHLLTVGQLKIGAALVLLAPFIPMLFQGEEFAAASPFQYFTDHEDPDVGRAVTEGRRNEFASFGWDPQSVPDPQSAETYERSKLNWNETGKEPHRSILSWYRILIRLRRTHSDFTNGNLDHIDVQFDERQRWLSFRRGKFTVISNFAGSALRREVAAGQTLLLASDAECTLHGVALNLPAHSIAIISD
jgi:maltooligosyltrehalose trehalohydrolase